MFSFLKKKATASEVAEALMVVSAAQEQLDEDVAEIKRIQPDLSDEKCAFITKNLMFLRAFAADFATSMTLGESREKLAVLDAFSAHWDDWERDSGLPFRQEMERCFEIYTNAIKESHPNGPAWQVGKAFSRICTGQEHDLDLVMLGNVHFASTYNKISNVKRKFKIVLS